MATSRGNAQSAGREAAKKKRHLEFIEKYNRRQAAISRMNVIANAVDAGLVDDVKGALDEMVSAFLAFKMAE